MYEFEKNKANNLILYGITVKHPETSESLKNRIANVFRDHLNIRREIAIQKATRVHTGKRIIRRGIQHETYYNYKMHLSNEGYTSYLFLRLKVLTSITLVQYLLLLKHLKIEKLS